ncbi:MAG: DDE-type integrase/transposase/recombinase [Candidatus Rokubacteria bacterium]|nr:DDE-type integrase/transposase/recombinase [Candidatus Rokubacteria bacterium]
MPFPLREWHTDNGSEFINAVLIPWCRREGIQVTRGRGYRKNDQAWVEQKNRLVVRRLIGYDRYSSRAAYALLQRLYDVLRRQLNCFRPVRKLLRKERHGARVLKRYAPPQTPYQRLLAIGTLSDAQRQALEGQFLALNPVTLARHIDQTLEALWKLAESQRPRTQLERG